jgi:Ca2+/H+ antiporter
MDACELAVAVVVAMMKATPGTCSETVLLATAAVLAVICCARWIAAVLDDVAADVGPAAR